jgi:hypothetical protein
VSEGQSAARAAQRPILAAGDGRSVFTRFGSLSTITFVAGGRCCKKRGQDSFGGRLTTPTDLQRIFCVWDSERLHLASTVAAEGSKVEAGPAPYFTSVGLSPSSPSIEMRRERRKCRSF